jgi:hypothetical protein
LPGRGSRICRVGGRLFDETVDDPHDVTPPPSGSFSTLGSSPRPDAPLIRFPGREYLLWRLPLQAALSPPWTPPGWPHEPQTPSLWWPDDVAWVVATDVDPDSTYVAGSAALVADLLGHPELEAVRASPDDPV